MALLDPALLRHLARLEVLTRRVDRGALAGDRLSSALGRSLDFAQHREYLPGDDLRLIDWNVYARQERYVLKQFEAEVDLQLYLLVDQSASMDFGTPTKAHRARQIAAAIGYVALSGLDRVHVYGLAEGVVDAVRGLRGRNQVATLTTFLEHLPVGGGTDLFGAVRAFAAGDPLPGMVILHSDCWDLRRFQDAVRLLRFHKHDVVVLQIVSPEELAPELYGDVELIDSESGEQVELTATPGALARYEAAVRRMTRTLRRFVTRQGGRFFQVTTATPVEEVVRDVLLRSGLLGPG